MTEVDTTESLLDMDLDNIPEQQLAAPGEYDLSIIKAEIQLRGDDELLMLFLIFKIETEGFEDAPPIFESLWVPRKDSEKWQYDNNRRVMKTFCEAFGIDTSIPVAPETLKGLRGQAFVKEGKHYRTGEPQNQIGRFI